MDEQQNWCGQARGAVARRIFIGMRGHSHDRNAVSKEMTMQKLSSVVRQFCVRFSVMAFASLALAMCAWGQYNASVQGTVTDPSGAAVPNAKVTVTNQATGVSAQTTTSASGGYTVGELPPGNYTVTVEASGFSKIETKDVVVLAEQNCGVDVKLTVGGGVKVVTVDGATRPG